MSDLHMRVFGFLVVARPSVGWNLNWKWAGGANVVEVDFCSGPTHRLLPGTLHVPLSAGLVELSIPLPPCTPPHPILRFDGSSGTQCVVRPRSWQFFCRLRPMVGAKTAEPVPKLNNGSLDPVLRHAAEQSAGGFPLTRATVRRCTHSRFQIGRGLIRFYWTNGAQQGNQQQQFVEAAKAPFLLFCSARHAFLEWSAALGPPVLSAPETTHLACWERIPGQVMLRIPDRTLS